MADDGQKFVSIETKRKAEEYARKECPNPDLRYFYEQAYIAGATFAIEKAIRIMEHNSVWSGMGYKVNYPGLQRDLYQLHNYPKELYEDCPEETNNKEETV